MELKVIGTGSSGNCYFLNPKEGKGLLIECGLTFKEIKAGIDYQISNIECCILSHEHKSDHAKCPQDIINAGIPIYTSYGTSTALNLKNSNCIRSGEYFEKGNFKIKAFNVVHDAIEPLGFLISHPEMGVMVFATDTKEINYKFPNINHWLIEANFSEELIMKSFESDNINFNLANRIYENHMSIETCIETLLDNDLKQTKTITLIHLSNTNADGESFSKKVSRAIGIKPFIAEKNLVINL